MNVHIIYGSPLSGKSTYVEEVVGDNDIVFDYDKVMDALSLRGVHNHNDHLMEYVLDVRSLVISKLLSETNIDNAYIITTKVTDDLKDSLIGLNPEYHKMEIDILEAKRRLRNDPSGRDSEKWLRAIDRYYTNAKDVQGFHNTAKWKRKREYIRKRDSHLCKECSRYGISRTGNTVHHIYPVEVRPDLRLTNSNLITLCAEHHGKMHNPFKDELSNSGKELLKRTTHKHPELKDISYEL